MTELPACMMPDGGDPCLAFTILQEKIERLIEENRRFRAALQYCAADWISAPGTVMSAAQGLSAEFRRRMELAHTALTIKDSGDA